MSGRTGLTRVEPWLVSKLTAAFGDAFEGKTRLEMPPFQRGIVWSSPKQAELIRSLKAGYPVGSLLFYKRPPDSNGREVNLLIDGLQRTTAIREYTDRPLSFMTIRDVDSVALSRLQAAIESATGVLDLGVGFSEAIAEWMEQTKTLKPNDGFDAHGLVKILNQTVCADAPVLTEDVVVQAIRDFQKTISDECNIEGIEIPVLFYEGSEADLPDIFERINATGTKLSKYEVFAASWVTQEIEVTSEKVLEAIRKRYYTLMTKNNIAVNGVRADGTPERLSLFDYLFGLGRLLADTHPLLFGGSDDPTVMESVSFALATVCYRLPLSQMHRLPKVMDRDSANRLRPAEFEEAILESAAFVSDVLAPFIGLKLNSESASSAAAHTDLQIASMVARAFSGRYVSGTWEIRDGAVEDRLTLAKRLPQYYLIDVLQQNWRGSGDSRLFQMVWDVEKESEGDAVHSPGRHFLREVTFDDFDRALEQWFSDQVRLSQRSRAYVTAPARAFLKFAYSDTVTVHAENKQTFELDHIFPVSRLVGPAKVDDDGWPISAVANLALFDWQTNREKSKMDLIQYLEKVDSSEQHKKQSVIEQYLFLPASDAAIPLDVNGADALRREDYEAFLRKRFDKMKTIVREVLEIPTD